MLGEAPRGRSLPLLAAVLLLTTIALPLVPATSAASVHVVLPGEPITPVVEAATPGDTILLKAGIHPYAIFVNSTEGITITGEGQGVTILDGSLLTKSRDGILIRADGVTVQDLTVQNFPRNGVFYTEVLGFDVVRVSAIDNGPYGIYAIRSRIGTVTDSFASGHRDSGFYIGEIANCICFIERVEARDNLIGYSGTGAGGIVIRDSLWENNAAGIVPNVLPSEPELQTNLLIVNNTVRNNNNVVASTMWHFTAGFHVPAGLGIVIAGGINDLVKDNVVEGHDLAGVAITFLFVEPSLNKVVDNTLTNNGPDILWDQGGVNNCFEGNLRDDGDPVTYEAGPVYALVGLPDCSTPNAGPPSPLTLTRLGTLLLFGCEPEEMPLGPRCHTDHVGS